MNAVLRFDPAGSVHCFYTEAVPLQELGRLTVSRATFVEFNDGIQSWEVLDPNRAVLFQNRSRQSCLDWEHQHFNR